MQWLTHARSASRFDGEIGLEATINIGLVVVKVMNRWLRVEWLGCGCPACGSRQLSARKGDNDPGEFKFYRYDLYCEVCGWKD